MKNLLLTLLTLLCFCSISKAQDIITTLSGKEIKCRIVKVLPDKIYFKYSDPAKAGPVYSILMDKVKSYVYNRQVPKDKEPPITIFIEEEKAKIEPQMIDASAPPPPEKAPLPRLHLGLNAGLGYMTGSMVYNLNSYHRDYYSELKTGFGFYGKADFFFTRVFGAGIGLSYMSSKNSRTDVLFTDSTRQLMGRGSLSNDVTLYAISGSFSVRAASRNGRTIFISNAGVCYISYTNREIALNNSYILTGNTFGTNLSVGIEQVLSDVLSVGLQLGYPSGLLTSVKVNGTNANLEPKDYLSVSHLFFGAGIRFLIR